MSIGWVAGTTSGRMIVVLTAATLGLGLGWLSGSPIEAGSTSGGVDVGPAGADPGVLVRAEDPLLGTSWELVTYEDPASGWTCLDTMAYDAAGSPIGGGGGCDPAFPPSEPALGTATVEGSTGTSLAVVDTSLPAASLWYGSAWGRVSCDGCEVTVTWVTGARTPATVDGGYWIAYHPMPVDLDDGLVEAVTT